MEVYDVVLIPLIVGITELCKRAGLPSKFAALLSLILGVVVGVIYIAPGDILKGILLGASIGLGASGLYSGTKNTIEGIKEA